MITILAIYLAGVALASGITTVISDADPEEQLDTKTKVVLCLQSWYGVGIYIGASITTFLTDEKDE